MLGRVKTRMIIHPDCETGRIGFCQIIAISYPAKVNVTGGRYMLVPRSNDVDF